ncbi:MAG: branched-chain amino acid transport system substrate-binding protein [Acidimicrobiaceae bacterium]
MIIVLSGALLVTACGSRRSDAELLALARGADSTGTEPGGTSVVGVGGASGSTSIGGAGVTGPGAIPGQSPDVVGRGAAGQGDPAASDDAAVAAPCPHQLSPIIIGSVGEYSGILGAVLKPGMQAVQAWAASVNADGGLKCHPVQYIVADDGGDPSTHQALVRRLVEEQGVIAFVHMSAPLAGQASFSYLSEHQIPVVGGSGSQPWYFQSPTYFMAMTDGLAAVEGDIAAIAKWGHANGMSNYGQVVCLEAAQCKVWDDKAPEYTQRYGLNLVYRGQASLTQPDFTAVCQNAQDAGVQLFLVALDTNSARRLFRNCKSVGYSPVFVTGGALVTPDLIADDEAEGALAVTATIPPIHTDNPSIARFQSVLAQFAPGLALNMGSIPGWPSAMLFERAAQSVSEPPTSASLLQALWSIKDDDLGGITAPLTFNEGQNAVPRICFWTLRIHDRAIVDASDGSRTCE